LPLSTSAVNVTEAYVKNVLVASHVVLVDHALIVSVHSLALAVIVLLVARELFGLFIVMIGNVLSILAMIVVVFDQVNQFTSFA